jgi:Tol biopolymer transport system component
MMLLAGTCLVGSAAAVEVQSRDGGHVQNPVFSPDGNWIAFEINDLGNTVDLWVAAFKSGAATGARQLKIPGASSSFGGGGGFAAAPEWLPPSQMIFFEGGNPGGDLRIYYASPAGGAPAEFISSTTLQGNLTAPTISADGSRFAFVSDSTGKGDIYVWNLVGGGDPQIASPSPNTENFPAFNRDGDKVAFSRKSDGTEGVFHWTDGGGGVVYAGSGDQTRPVWAGGSVVFFSRGRGAGTWDIAMAAPGGGRTVVARNVKLPARSPPSISPDGTSVLWVSSEPSKAGSIMVSQLDGGGTKEIATGLVACGEPSLTEVGGKFFLAFTALPPEGTDWRRLHIVDVTGRL